MSSDATPLDLSSEEIAVIVLCWAATVIVLCTVLNLIDDIKERRARRKEAKANGPQSQ